MSVDEIRKPEGPIIDWDFLQISIYMFIAGAGLPLIFQWLYGASTILIMPWAVFGRGFHELGHVLVHWVFQVPVGNPMIRAVAGSTLVLSGFGGNVLGAVGLLWFSFYARSRINRGTLRTDLRGQASACMWLGYLNLYYLYFTLTHLSTVVGPGLDFTSTCQILDITLPELLAKIWVVHWAVYGVVIALNLYFVFRPGIRQLYQRNKNLHRQSDL
jgi:hypothetical protein